MRPAIDRLQGAACIRRGTPISFTFNGRRLTGFEGDTLASALLANGERVVARSFKLHRPRGIVAAGVEEPNAIVTVGEGAWAVPNLRATEVELHDGLVARSVNCWPGPNLDVGAVAGLFSRLLPAGFYYKTFKWPGWWLYEGVIRRAAGLGVVPAEPDPDRYEHRHARCDVLVVGAGPAGLAAAATVARSGAQVMLVEQAPMAGGSLVGSDEMIDGVPSRTWIADRRGELDVNPNCTILMRTTAFGYYDHNHLGLIERVTDRLTDASPRHIPRERLWQVRAGCVVLATGAIQRPIIFPENDRPGVMLADAVVSYARRYGVRCGQKAVVFTLDDSGYAGAAAMHAAGIAVAAIVDPRPGEPPVGPPGAEVLRGWEVRGVAGRRGVSAVKVVPVDGAGSVRRIVADLLAMAGGWSPSIHLFCQSGGHPRFESGMFIPGDGPQRQVSAGAARGLFPTQACVDDGVLAGRDALAMLGLAQRPEALVRLPTDPRTAAHDWWSRHAPHHAWVDFQNDVTAADVALAAREGYRSVEHLKRYTTLGMAVDQGKTSNVNGLSLLAAVTERTPGETGTTRFRPPFTPVTLGALAGRRRGTLFAPLRRLPAHEEHRELGALFEEMGGWARPVAYPRNGEDLMGAAAREARAVRCAAGLFDASSLGKIEIRGPDAARFLDRVYANTMGTLKAGRVRYGLMLNENGVIIDDGVCACLATDHYLVGTTSGNAKRICAWLEEWHQTEWPDLRVAMLDVTAMWGTLALSGPTSRSILQAVGTDLDLAADAFPHMAVRCGHIAGVSARIARVSFTGEVSFEISIPAGKTADLWRRLLDAGASMGLTPVGIEAWMMLRAEKGYIHLGTETDGTTTPDDIGWGGPVRKKQGDFIGRRSLARPANQSAEREQFVGIQTLDPRNVLPVGAHLVSKGRTGGASEGWVSTSYASPVLGSSIALGRLRRGRERLGEELTALTPSGPVPVRVTEPCVYDPSGERLNG